MSDKRILQVMPITFSGPAKCYGVDQKGNSGMSDIADIAISVFTVFKDNFTVNVDADPKGMAYAIPDEGVTLATIEDNYGPWSRAELRRRFTKESLLGATMADVEMIMS
jgi:hypothetical protein